jgi:hypothetical protein
MQAGALLDETGGTAAETPGDIKRDGTCKRISGDRCYIRISLKAKLGSFRLQHPKHDQRRYEMKRRLFKLATAVSLVLFVPTVALWMYSYVGKGGNWAWLSPPTRYHFVATEGVIDFGFQPVSAANPVFHYWHTTVVISVIDGTMDGRFFIHIYFPLWLPALIFSAFPLIRAVRWYRRPTPAGVCPTCGYDLRATPDRCPECETLVSNGGAAAA